MIKITSTLSIDDAEIVLAYIRSPGPGGQNVNKVATAVMLRFNVLQSPALPELMRQRVMRLAGSKMANSGELVIKATRYRTQERNRQDALNRLVDILRQAAVVPKKRKKTKPTYSSVQKRLDSKKLHSKAKSLRRHKGRAEE